LTVRLDSKYSEQTNTCEFRKAVNLANGQGGLKLEIIIPPQHILAKSKGGLIIEGGVISSEYGTGNHFLSVILVLHQTIRYTYLWYSIKVVELLGAGGWGCTGGTHTPQSFMQGVRAHIKSYSSRHHEGSDV